MAEPCIAVDPVVRSLSVQSPVRFVGVDGVIAAAELLGNVVHNRLRFVGQHGLETDQRRWRERDAEEFFNCLRDLSVADPNHIPKIDCRTSQM